MGKKLLIVANWKANIVDSTSFIVHREWSEEVEIVIAPPFTQIDQIKGFTVTSQDISMFPAGAYTGEVTGEMLKSLGVKYCLIGHSERRKYFGETNEIVEKKLERALSSGIVPIICAQSAIEIPANIRNYSSEKFVLMYEPFSAISANGEYHPEDPQRVQLVLEEWKNKLNLNCRFLYGGSINAEDVSSFVNLPLVSGFVVGHASLDPNDFFSIIKQCLTPLTSV